MKKKRGRPKLPEGKAKQVFSIRLNPEDLTRFQKMAKAQKMSLREWIGERLSGAINPK